MKKYRNAYTDFHVERRYYRLFVYVEIHVFLVGVKPSLLRFASF